MSNQSTTSAIEAVDLHKSFGAQVVLDGISLNVAPGTVYALLGPNGAGKTTLVNILTTLLPSDSGHARVAGFDVARDGNAVRSTIGVTGQFAAVDGVLNGKENLQLMADLNHLPRVQARARITELLERFDLVDAAKNPAVTYSGGMRRRLDLAMSLIRSPKIVFLDEPTTGVDPRGRAIMWDIVRSLVNEGVTIFLTTQYLEEADQLADRIAVLNRGRIVAEGTAAELKRLVPGGHIDLQINDPATLSTAARVFPESVPNEADLTLRVPGDDGIASLRGVLDTLDRAGITAESLQVTTPDLDDVFFALTGPEALHERQGGHTMSTTTPSARQHPLADSLTMLRRNLLHNVKSPIGTIIVIAIPLIFLLLFVYVFGGTLGAGLGGGGDRSEYLAYITPAILLMGAASASQMIAVWISTDISEGIIARFRTMSISPGSVLAGHAYGGLIQALISVSALLGVAVLIGFRPTASPLQWLALAGFVILIAFALAWLSVGFGLAAKGPETASNLTMLLILLPLLSGGFVPVDSMPDWLQGFAQYQPFTPIIETLRGLLSGTPNGADALIAISWLLGIALIGYIWSRWLYRRRAVSP